MPESLPSAQVPSASSDAPAASSWVFCDAEIGMEIRLPVESWRTLPLFPGCRARLIDEKTGVTLLVLSEYEKTDSGSMPSSEILEATTRHALDRFFPQYEPPAFGTQQLGGQKAMAFKTKCGQDGQVVGVLIQMGEQLIKILLCFPQGPQTHASQLVTTALSAIHMLPPTAKPPETPLGFVPYDVRLGIPVADWEAATSGDVVKEVAVCHEGAYHGVLDAAALRKRLASNRLHGQSLVFVAPAESGQLRRWLPLEVAAKSFPSLSAVSPILDAMKSAVGIAAIVALVLGIPYGIYSACVHVSSSVSFGAAVEAGVLLIGTVVVGVPIGVFGFKFALNMLGKDPMQGLVALLFCVVCVTSPVWVLGMAGSTLLGVVWYLIKWVSWLIWVVILFAIVCGAVGAAIGAIVGWLRQRTATQRPVSSQGPSTPPAPNINLWLPAL